MSGGATYQRIETPNLEAHVASFRSLELELELREKMSNESADVTKGQR